MSDDTLTIPADVARNVARELRALMDGAGYGEDDPRRPWADLLDPKPLTLREQVARAIAASDNNPWRDVDEDSYFDNANAALAVVRDAIAALPYTTVPHWSGAPEKAWRESDVLALLDGGAR